MSDFFPAESMPTRCCYRFADNSRCTLDRTTHSFCEAHAKQVRRASRPSPTAQGPEDKCESVGQRRLLLDPASMYVTHIFDGEEVVRGGEDGQAYVATFASFATAKEFIDACVQHRVYVSGLRPDCTPSAKAGAVSEALLDNVIETCRDSARKDKQAYYQIAVELKRLRSTPAPDVCDVVGCLHDAERTVYVDGVRTRMCIGCEKKRTATEGPYLAPDVQGAIACAKGES